MSVAPVVIATLVGLGIIADRITSRTLEEIRLRLIHDDLLAALDDLIRDVVYQATAQILVAIDNVRRQIDEDVALDAIALADRALFVDGAKNRDAEAALGNSFQAAHRLSLETDAVFATAFIHTVNLRLAILRHFKEHYYCDAGSRREFEDHIAKINGWCRQIDDTITRQHTVKVQLRVISTRPEPRVRWEATHARAGEVVATFGGEVDDVSPATRDRVEGRANTSRSRAIAAERRDVGLVEMEKPAQLWNQAFRRDSGAALARDLLDQSPAAGDGAAVTLDVSAPGGTPSALFDARSALLEALAGDEFRGRIRKSWDALVHQGDDRLIQLAHRRLFGRDASPDEAALLRGIASRYGQAAFMATLLRSQEYESRYGGGFPAAGPPIAGVLDAPDNRAVA
jgi:hypothetical protein